ncbi:MAG: hypothetical protein RLN94_13515 [Roseovarius sp.]|uniref:hypothetical protein n=1 Tax=Roseovarius sp. TaxID=1486281 RepID=UPI0032EF4AEA
MRQAAGRDGRAGPIQSLLVRAGGQAARRVGAEHLDGLHFSTVWRRDAAEGGAGRDVFIAGGQAFAVSDPLSAALLDRLEGAFPGTCALGELVDGMASGGGAAGGPAEEGIREALFRLVAGGQVEVSSVPLRTGRASDMRPEVWPLARCEAGAGQPWLSSLRHGPESLEPGLAGIVALLDGTLDRAALAARVRAGVEDETITLGGSDLSEQKGGQARSEAVDGIVDRLLLWLERGALLQPGG